MHRAARSCRDAERVSPDENARGLRGEGWRCPRRRDARLSHPPVHGRRRHRSCECPLRCRRHDDRRNALAAMCQRGTQPAARCIMRRRRVRAVYHPRSPRRTGACRTESQPRRLEACHVVQVRERQHHRLDEQPNRAQSGRDAGAQRLNNHPIPRYQTRTGGARSMCAARETALRCHRTLAHRVGRRGARTSAMTAFAATSYAWPTMRLP